MRESDPFGEMAGEQSNLVLGEAVHCYDTKHYSTRTRRFNYRSFVSCVALPTPHFNSLKFPQMALQCGLWGL